MSMFTSDFARAAKLAEELCSEVTPFPAKVFSVELTSEQDFLSLVAKDDRLYALCGKVFSDRGHPQKLADLQTARTTLVASLKAAIQKP